jgi:UDP-glucose 4-epimerase
MAEAKTIAVIGAAGTVGGALCRAAAARGHSVIALARHLSPSSAAAYEWRASGDLARRDDLSALMAGAEIVINCVGRTAATASDGDLLERVNSALPERLAQAAAAAGARRFVHFSSLAAIASETSPGETLDDSTPPRPSAEYGRSKLAGDGRLEAMTDAIDIVILRPPAIYGPGAGGPLALLAKAARLGLPLPLGNIENRRSIAFIDNVADAALAAALGTATGTYIMTDSPPVSTALLYRKLLNAFGRPDRVWRWPRPLVRAFTAPLGRRAASLIGDAACDGARFMQAFDWRPPVALDDAILQTANAMKG